MADIDALKKLRDPFAANQIGQLPKPFKSDAPKGRCDECGGWHGLPAMHLDFVGHAALTDRFLDVDPEWTWKPMAVDPTGMPLLDRNGGLWIWLTLCGVTRPGYGDASGKSGGNAVKEAIGDALRNAGMRFGAALDLWHKGDLHDAQGEQAPQRTELDDALDELDDAVAALNLQVGEVASKFYAAHKKPPRESTAQIVREFIESLHDRAEQGEQGTL